MRAIVRGLLGFCCSVVVCDGAKALEISGDTIVSGNYIINEDVTVQNGVSFEAHDIRVVDSLRIFNYGHIDGTIDICENCTVEIKNVGTFNAGVLPQTGAHLVQVISSNDEITNLGLGTGFDVRVRNGDGLNLAAIMSAASNADTIEFRDVYLDAGNIDEFVAPSNVELGGRVVLRFNDFSYQSVLLFSDASGDGVVHVDSGTINPLYAIHTYKVNNDVFMQLKRSTDYARILNNGTGKFLGDLRASGVDNKLFSVLDAVSSVDEINDILSQSVRTNPIKLMRPISLMNSYKTLEMMHIDDDIMFGIEPMFISSSNIFIYGVRPNISVSVDDVYMKISGHFMNIDCSDNINEYGGVSVGLGIDAQYDILDNNFLRGYAGISKAFFDIGPVFTGGTIVNNPDGTSAYAIGEYGHAFDVSGGYEVAPFVGLGTEYLAVANAQDTKLYGIGGADIRYKYEFDGLRYDYGGRVIVRTDSWIGAGINLGVWSIMDAAGADVHIDTIYNNDFGMSWKIGLNGRFMF